MSESREQGPEEKGDRRGRWAADFAAGRTVSLSGEDLADPALRGELPELLSALAGAGAGAVGLGLQFPGYTVLGAIGHGGMSTVYLARQDRLGRYVALKVAAWGGADRKARQRMVQEARALARVAHPNIVAIHDIVDVGETVAIALEWIDGLTLEALLRHLPGRPGPGDMEVVCERLGAPPSVAASSDAAGLRFFVRTMRDVARAVQRVHEAGLLHLDIKPSNVIVRRDGTPLLADFGVVREIDVEASRARSFAGTPIYSAPEQLTRNDRGFAPHTDVYGLGITLYEVLARNQPLRDQDLTRLVHSVERGRIPPLGTQISIAKDLETIVHKAMRPDPQQRYRSAADFADDLDAFLEGRPVAARPLSRVRRLQRWARLEPWKALLAAVLLVTVPVVAVLAVELILGQRYITAGRARELQQQASQLKQLAFQAEFTNEHLDASELLLEAMQLDPGDTSLVCLAFMTADRDIRTVLPLLERHRDVVSRTVALQVLEDLARSGRPYFDADEVARIAVTGNPSDRYALALERTLRAEDLENEEAHLEALVHIQAAMMSREPDPLLLGLCAWCASLVRDLDLRDHVCRTMRRLWPDSVAALRWECFTMEMAEVELPVHPAREWIARDPHEPRAWALLVGQALREGRVEAARALLAEAAAVPVSSSELDSQHVRVLLHAGDAEGARRRFAATPSLDGQPVLALAVARAEGVDVWQACAERMIAEPVPRQHVLADIVRTASSMPEPQRAVGRRAFERWRELYPHHRRLFRFEVQRRFHERDMAGAARAAEGVRTRWSRIDDDGEVMCRLHVAIGDWVTLADCAQRWYEHGDGSKRRQAASFAGLAASRRGDLAAAASYLAVATVARDEGVWYVMTLLESAWVHVAPATPAALRDPERARLLLERFTAANEALESPRGGPWIHAVTAEVRFACGDREGAMAAARAGLAARRDPRVVPPSDLRAILEAAVERYGR